MWLARFRKPRAAPRRCSRRTIDRIGGAVAGAGLVEVGQDVASSSGEGPAESDHLAQRSWDVLADRVDDLREFGFPGGAVGVAVGGDDALVDAPGGLNLDVRFVGKGGVQPLPLLVGD